MDIQQAAQQALDVQDACNLSGVVFSFAEVMHAICEEQQRLGQSTEWKNTHPVVTLFLSKLTDLSRNQDFFKAHDTVKRIAEKEAVTRA